MNILLVVIFAALNFTQVDAKFNSGRDFSLCKAELEALLPKAETKEDKAGVLWRLSRVSYMLGEEQNSNETRRKEFSSGVNYGRMAIEASPKDPECYIWHCANVGRECQTHSLPEQAKAVPIMMKDLEMILYKLGRTDFSAAWQALSEIYWNHPFKSNNEAIDYARKAALTIPDGELRLSTYVSLAKMLRKRDWSASKRSSEYKSGAQAADGLGANLTPMWLDKKLSECSDGEEAAALLNYAAKLYSGSGDRTPIDKKDYIEIQKLLK